MLPLASTTGGAAAAATVVDVVGENEIVGNTVAFARLTVTGESVGFVDDVLAVSEHPPMSASAMPNPPSVVVRLATVERVARPLVRRVLFGVRPFMAPSFVAMNADYDGWPRGWRQLLAPSTPTGARWRNPHAWLHQRPGRRRNGSR